MTPRREVPVSSIPVAHTPPGGWVGAWPEPVLAACTEPPAQGVPDLRGLWRTVSAVRGGEPVDPDDRVHGHVQRIEQAGDRVVITAGGIIHDMRADGTVEHGVHDVAEFDHTTPIVVVATFEDQTHVLRPVGIPIEVSRRLDPLGRLIWDYLGTTVTLERIGGPNDTPPSGDGVRPGR